MHKMFLSSRAEWEKPRVPSESGKAKLTALTLADTGELKSFLNVSDEYARWQQHQAEIFLKPLSPEILTPLDLHKLTFSSTKGI